MKRALILQHVPHEPPGCLVPALAARGLTPDIVRLDRGTRVPSTIDDDVAALVVMGGPMGVSDIGDPRYPFLADEVPLLRQAIARDLPTIGICLGAQLLAHAAGARVYPNVVGTPPVPVREVGWGAVHFTRSGAEEPALAGLAPAEVVLHWHGDTFDLPAGATLLASTLPCRHQMFRLGRRMFAIQFHIELDAAGVAAFLEADAGFVRIANGPDGCERLRADTIRWLPSFEKMRDRLITNVLGVMLAG